MGLLSWLGFSKEAKEPKKPATVAKLEGAVFNQYDAVRDSNYYSPRLSNQTDENLTYDQMQLHKLRKSATYWYRNSPVAHSIVTQFVAQIMQKDGITVEPAPLKQGGKVDAALAHRLKSLWQEFGTSVLIGEKYVDFNAFLHALLTTYFCDGEVYVEMVEYLGKRDGKKVSLFGLRLFTADQLDNNGEDGVVRNSNGDIVEYVFTVRTSDYLHKTYRVPVDNLLILRNTNKVNLKRGLPIFSECIREIHYLDTLTRALVDTGLMQAQVFGVLEQVNIPPNHPNLYDETSFNMSLQSSDDGFLNLFSIPAGRTLKIHGMGTGNIDWMRLREQLLYSICSSCGISYEAVTQKYENSYSAARQSAINTDNVVGMHTKRLISQVIRPLYRRFVEFMIKLGKFDNNRGLTVDYNNYLNIFNAQYHEAKRPSIDPVKDAKATSTLVQAGLMSFQQAQKQHGTNSTEFIRDLVTYAELFEKNDLMPFLHKFYDINQAPAKDPPANGGDSNDVEEDNKE